MEYTSTTAVVGSAELARGLKWYEYLGRKVPNDLHHCSQTKARRHRSLGGHRGAGHLGLLSGTDGACLGLGQRTVRKDARVHRNNLHPEC